MHREKDIIALPAKKKTAETGISKSQESHFSEIRVQTFKIPCCSYFQVDELLAMFKKYINDAFKAATP
jgi:hypothetical protein